MVAVSSGTNKNRLKTESANPHSIGAPLWSWLVMAERRSEFFCPPSLNVTIQELYQELCEHLVTNDVPAEAKLLQVDWDESGTVQRRILVRYTGTDEKNDVVQLLVGVDQVGRFAYVEKKTLIHPPVLPVKPRKRNDSDSGLIFLLLFGIVLVGIGLIVLVNLREPGRVFFSLFAVLVGGAIAWRCMTKINAARQWNNMVSNYDMVWSKTWDDWLEKKSWATYVRKANELFGRVIDAVSGSIDRVSARVLVSQGSNGGEMGQQGHDSHLGLVALLTGGVCIALGGLIVAVSSRDFVGVLFCLALLVAGVGIGWRSVTKISSVNEWNAASIQEKKEWDKAWEDWLEMRLRAAYLSKTNDVFGRFIEAVSSSTDQVLKKLFVDQEAELRKESEEKRTQEEIEKEMEKKRREALA